MYWTIRLTFSFFCFSLYCERNNLYNSVKIRNDLYNSVKIRDLNIFYSSEMRCAIIYSKNEGISLNN